ncbi:chemotaxis-specific protein-glutamate methyltransferase CheB [candidate division CSSED10-310 bacterium]|uniref:Protein-glutamate methylesterase/protein-glutamine glutaminase n=1 Tax=candidate division CSSED10-310 bacterium TaxID=2855610 RepID=A0ABV6Z4X1_UNCC1
MTEEEKISVLIVDDSPISREVLQTIIETSPDFEIVGLATNGEEAIDAVDELRPDIVTMDLNMPIMNGYEAIENIMAYNPTPILVVTTAEFEKDTNIAFEALAVGALDIINRPQIPDDMDEDIGEDAQEFLNKLRMLSKVGVITHVRGKLSRKAKVGGYQRSVQKLVVIGSSTGGPKALKEIFDNLPPDFETPIVAVQHMSDGFIPGLVKWLDSSSPLSVQIAEDGAQIESGNVYIAPTGFHLTIKKSGILEMVDLPPVNGIKPCADFLFESAARVYGSKVLAVILSGMGDDGAQGSSAIKASGGKIIVQDKATSVIFSMPQNVINRGCADAVKPITEIADEIQKQLTYY